MTQLLISVTSVAEAQIALENGADIIDLKNPSAGALGALPFAQIQAIADYVHNQDAPYRKPVSATIGDVPMQPQLVYDCVAKLTNTKVDFIKIGFFEADDYQPCLDALQNITQTGVKLVAVLFAEHHYPDDFIDAIKNAGFSGVMLDTAKKNGLSLMDHYSGEQCKNFAERVLKLDLTLGLAGSLKIQHVALAKQVNPTYVGFRGGVCDEGQRVLSLNADKLQAIRKVL